MSKPEPVNCIAHDTIHSERALLRHEPTEPATADHAVSNRVRHRAARVNPAGVALVRHTETPFEIDAVDEEVGSEEADPAQHVRGHERT